MSIPGIDDGPVSQEQERFKFNIPPGEGGAENADGARKSRYEIEGKFPGKVVKFKQALSTKGNPQFVLTVVGTGGAAKGLKYTTYMQLTGEKGPQITAAVLKKVFGIKANEAGDYDFAPSDVEGKDCTMNIVRDVYEGKVGSKCSTLYPANEAAAPINSDDIPF